MTQNRKEKRQMVHWEDLLNGMVTELTTFGEICYYTKNIDL